MGNTKGLSSGISVFEARPWEFFLAFPEVTPSRLEGVSSGTDTIVCGTRYFNVVSGDYGDNELGKEGNSRLETAGGF